MSKRHTSLRARRLARAAMAAAVMLHASAALAQSAPAPDAAASAPAVKVLETVVGGSARRLRSARVGNLETMTIHRCDFDRGAISGDETAESIGLTPGHR